MQECDSHIHDLLYRLRIVGNKIPDVLCVYPLEAPIFGTGISQSDIASLEAAIKAPLPKDFLAFQKLCGFISAMDIWNGYSLMEASRINALIVDAHSPPAIQVVNGQSTLIPIGGDGGGNLFLTAFADSYHISKWNHETGSQEKLADSFTEFLERMLEDWEHFVIQDSDWKYMSG